MSRLLEDEEWLLHQSLPRSLASQRRDPFIKTCITYSGAACVGFTLLLVAVFVCVIAYDVRKADGRAVAVFPVKVRSQRRGPVPILCHVNVARFYDNDVSYRTVDLPGNYCSHLVLPLRGFFSGTNETPDAIAAYRTAKPSERQLPHLKYLIAVGDENGGGSRLTFHETPNATAYMTFLVEMVRWVLHNRFHGIVLNRGLHHPANATDRILIPLHHQRDRKGRSVEDFIENVISSGLPRSRVLLAISLSGFVCTMSRLPENKEVPRWIDTMRFVSSRTRRPASWCEKPIGFCPTTRRARSRTPGATTSGWDTKTRCVRKMASLVDKIPRWRHHLGCRQRRLLGHCGLTNPLVRAIFTEVEGTPVDDNSTAIIPSFNLTDSDAVHTLNKTSGKA
ncbi:hypothetical protein HPB52_014107 [Rhipicephalus sanguineus]|uniref:Uncharacterized protein n=1 Tax=Rhipicephalus sanguineus TaxID=34632 RepID=A0A9D4SYT3_RHISA|nr:hypothetical protein HPB52_014107 [Rhipicephalus sanguineus]